MEAFSELKVYIYFKLCFTLSTFLTKLSDLYEVICPVLSYLYIDYFIEILFKQLVQNN